MDRVYRDRVIGDLTKYFDRFELRGEPWVSAEERMAITPEKMAKDTIDILEKRCKLVYKVGVSVG